MDERARGDDAGVVDDLARTVPSLCHGGSAPSLRARSHLRCVLLLLLLARVTLRDQLSFSRCRPSHRRIIDDTQYSILTLIFIFILSFLDTTILHKILRF
jgi:hypothetical protein